MSKREILTRIVITINIAVIFYFIACLISLVAEGATPPKYVVGLLMVLFIMDCITNIANSVEKELDWKLKELKGGKD